VSINKILPIVALGSITAFGLSPVMAQTADVQSTQAQIDQLKRQVEALQRQQAASAPAAPAAPAAAAPAVKPTPHVAESGAHKLSLESADGLYSVGVTGRVHFDTGDYLSFKPDNAAVGTQLLSNGVNARRARIGVSGKLAGNWTYQFIYDGGNSQDATAAGIQAAQVSYTGFKGVIIDLPGYSEPPYPLDTAISSNEIMFMERAAPVNVATGIGAGDFRANTGVRFYGSRYWVGVYLTGPAVGDSHTNVHEKFGSFQRATAQVLNGSNYSLHIGANAYELLQMSDTGLGTARTLTLSDRPELRIDPTALLSTGSLGTVANPVTGAKVYGAELAGGLNSWYAQSEYFRYEVDRRGLATNNFEGYYGQVSWTLTGEHRRYSPTTGAYSAITPDHPVGAGGMGAWELAARYSNTNLTDDFVAGVAQASQPTAVNGGKLKSLTLGVNWYVNTYLRLMANYVHSELDKANGAAVTGAALGVPVGYKFDALAVRTQLSW
jgi:phosphate-selective porin OprO and OprP